MATRERGLGPLAIAAGVLIVAFTAVYLPAAGHGFVKDDFGWIARSRLHSIADAARLFVSAPTGFYRPIVSLSFGLTEPLCGLAPRCYGATNVLLTLCCAAAVFLLARALALPAAAALAASAIWIFNWHGINMATLWISGRTALLAVLFATLAGAAFVRGRVWLTVALMFGAMFAKEEAILLAPVLVGWAVLSREGARTWTTAKLLLFGIAAAMLVAVYLALRLQSGAFTPASAPPYYRLDVSLSRLAANLPGYLDRSLTFAAVALVLWLLVARPPRAAFAGIARPVLTFGLLWWIGTFAITVFLPVRSSLYACLPAVGSAIVAAAVIETGMRAASPERLRFAAIAGLVLPFALWPVYTARNRNAVREADLSSTTIAALRSVAAERGPRTVVRLRDDRDARPSLDSAFGTLVQVASDLMVQPPLVVWIDPPPGDAAYAGLVSPARFDVGLRLTNGSLVREP